ncbi:MAG: hypothetical protein ACI9J2_002584 [Saprospiraceae bacterium]|jgi:hypothetical protein
MAVKIEKKIVSYQVRDENEQAPATVAEPAQQLQITDSAIPEGGATIVQMHEKVLRPDMLVGSTYKIKTPVSEHAFYVTINDMVLNPSTPYEKRRPFEIFINSKNMDHYQWISALTLIISAVFRKGGDATFLVKELQSVFDPKGGYFKKGGKFVPSLVAEIGDAIEMHMKMIGMIKEDKLDEHQQKLVDAKRKEYDAKQAQATGSDEEGTFPPGSALCMKCSTKAAIMMDGCLTCLNCGDSKCG